MCKLEDYIMCKFYKNNLWVLDLNFKQILWIERLYKYKTIGPLGCALTKTIQ